MHKIKKINNISAKGLNVFPRDDYEISSDINELSKIRTSLRQSCLQSPVFDSKRFSKHFDQMLWKIWKDFDNG